MSSIYHRSFRIQSLSPNQEGSFNFEMVKKVEYTNFINCSTLVPRWKSIYIYRGIHAQRLVFFRKEQGTSFEFSLSVEHRVGGEKSKKNRRLSLRLIKERCKRSSGLYQEGKGERRVARRRWSWPSWRGSWRRAESIAYRAASSMQLIKFRMYVCVVHTWLVKTVVYSRARPSRKLVLGSTPPSFSRTQCTETAGNRVQPPFLLPFLLDPCNAITRFFAPHRRLSLFL